MGISDRSINFFSELIIAEVLWTFCHLSFMNLRWEYSLTSIFRYYWKLRLIQIFQIRFSHFLFFLLPKVILLEMPFPFKNSLLIVLRFKLFRLKVNLFFFSLIFLLLLDSEKPVESQFFLFHLEASFFKHSESFYLTWNVPKFLHR